MNDVIAMNKLEGVERDAAAIRRELDSRREDTTRSIEDGVLPKEGNSEGGMLSVVDVDV